MFHFNPVPTTVYAFEQVITVNNNKNFLCVLGDDHSFGHVDDEGSNSFLDDQQRQPTSIMSPHNHSISQVCRHILII